MAVRIKCRTVLWYLVFVGMIVFILLFVNINIAMIAMVKHAKNDKETIAECSNLAELTNTTKTAVENSREGTFQWTEMEQGWILGSVFWLFCLMQFPASYVVKKYGAKIMFGWSNLGQAILAFVAPAAAYHSFLALVIVRAMTGAFSALGFTVIPVIAANWIPPNERSHFMTCYLASGLAIAIGYPAFGWISEVLGWEWIFYSSGIVTVLWFIAWQTLMYNTPASHPRISVEERDYILSTLVDQSQENLEVPWRKIFTSGQVWACCFISWSYGYIFMFFVTYTPAFFKTVYGTDIKSSASLASIPHAIRMIIAFLVGRFADKFIKSGKVSRNNVRKFSSAVCTLGAGILFLVSVFVGCNMLLATVIFGIIIATSAFPNAGFFATMVDLAPNFVNIIFAICMTANGLSQVFCTFVVGYITDGDSSYSQWQKCFYINAAIGILPGLFYILYGRSEVQTWNHGEVKGSREAEEMMDLRKPRSTRLRRKERTESANIGFGSMIL